MNVTSIDCFPLPPSHSQKQYGLFHLISLHDTGCIQCSSLQLGSFVFNMNLHIKKIDAYSFPVRYIP